MRINVSIQVHESSKEQKSLQSQSVPIMWEHIRY